MRAQINHMAISSPNYPFLGRFYEAVFGMKCSVHRPFHGVVYSDGYCGLNINPKRDGSPGGLDHFGFVVDDAEEVLERMKKTSHDAEIVKRPSTRPFAAYSGADPDCNVFDLAQRKNDERKNMYADAAADAWNQERYLNRFAIRTKHPDVCADFYMEVFELTPTNRDRENGVRHLTDGRVTLSLMPWSISVFEGMAVHHTGPEHIGFRVESIDKLKEDVQNAEDWNQFLATFKLGGSPEAETRKAMFAKWATGKYQLADPEGTWIDVTDE